MPKEMPDPPDQTSLSVKERERLRRWLADWRVFEALGGYAKDLVDPGGTEPEFAGTFDRPNFDSDPKPGEIRLLSSRVLGDVSRAVYVALYADWENDWVLVAPYAPFFEPASPGELATGRPAPYLKVLSLWNTHSCPPRALADSWVVDHLSGTEMEEAFAVFRSIFTGKALDAGLRERVGPPLSEGTDPRHAYQNQETQLMAPLARKAMAAAQQAGFALSEELLLLLAMGCLMKTPRAAAGDELVSKLAIIESGELASIRERGVEAVGEVRTREEEGFALVVTPPARDRANPANGYLQWQIDPPVAKGIRAMVVDPERRTCLGEARLSKSGRTVTLTNVPWADLLPYSEDTHRLKNLIVVVIADEKTPAPN